jgi:hypothetical protein
VPDSLDACPLGTAAGADTDGDGCKDEGEDADDDNDGVLDGADACPVGTATGTDTDGDGCEDEGEDADDDNDGFEDADEGLVGTNSVDRCGTNGWPADLVGGGLSENSVTLQDISSFFAPDNRFGTSPPEATPGYHARWDLVPGPAVGGEWIGLQDLGALLVGATATPPMFGGAQVFNGPACTELP